MVNLASVVNNVSHTLIVLMPIVLPDISCLFVFPLSKISFFFVSKLFSFPHPLLLIYLTKSVALDLTSDLLKPCIFAPHMGNVQSMPAVYHIHLMADGDSWQG